MTFQNGQPTDAGYFIPTYTAGEDVSQGDTLAYNSSDGKVYKASASAWAYRINFIGFAVTSALNGNPVPVNEMPIVREKTGLTANTDYYLSDTNGAIATSAGTIERKVGRALTTSLIRRPKNGAPVSAYISRAFSASTAYAPLIVTITGQGGTGRSVFVNSTQIFAGDSADYISFSLSVRPSDSVTVTNAGDVYVQLVDR